MNAPQCVQIFQILTRANVIPVGRGFRAWSELKVIVNGQLVCEGHVTDPVGHLHHIVQAHEPRRRGYTPEASITNALTLLFLGFCCCCFCIFSVFFPYWFHANLIMGLTQQQPRLMENIKSRMAHETNVVGDNEVIS